MSTVQHAIFFDVDGTLLHFTENYERVLARTLEEVMGNAPNEWIRTIDETFKHHQASGSSEAYRKAFSAIEGLQSGDIDQILDRLQRNEVKASRTAPGVETTLDQLDDAYHLGVLTNGIRAWQQAKLAAFGLDEYFSVFIGCDDTGAMKPETPPFEYAERQFSAEEYVLVGDSQADRKGAQRAEWKFHAYTGEHFEEMLEHFD